MGVLDLFHKREERRSRAGEPDVFRYDALAPDLRRQIAMIMQATIGPWGYNKGYPLDHWNGENHHFWEVIEEGLRRELALFELTDDATPEFRVLNYFLRADTAKALSVVELSFRVIDRSRARLSDWRRRPGYPYPQKPEDAINELNFRFREHSVGYQYEAGDIVRLDQDFTHQEVVRPALALLSESDFAAADSHFRTAHRHYRRGEGPQAMGEALKSLESCLKAIFDRRGWPYPSHATAKPLLDIAFAHGLLPAGQQSYMTGVRAQLESGLPATANPNRHGQAISTSPPDYLVRFALQQAASSITLIVESDRALQRSKA